MKARVHVNQHNIRHNRGNPDDMRPVITVKTYKSNEYGDTVEINGPSVVLYSPDKPLSCGAKVWIECQYEDIHILERGAHGGRRVRGETEETREPSTRK
jgi:hypothetical protein